MQSRSYSKWIVIMATLIIWTIKFFVRPFIHLDHTIKFIAGIAPNLIGSFALPFAAYWLYTHPKFFNGMLLRFSFFSDARIVCSFGFVLVVANEYLQLIPFFGRTFDYYDILFSAVGSFAGYRCFIFSHTQKITGI